MKLPLKWITPILLRLSLSHSSLASSSSAFDGLGSVHLVMQFGVGIASSPSDSLSTIRHQPPVLNVGGDAFVQLTSHELSIPIMPLHLLGKKSWNVYNHDNIEKVKRDEATARAKEEAEDERMQEIDAERRMKILRGEEPTPLAIEETRGDEGDNEKRIREPGRERKKRKRFGEDDTDFELRLASEQVKAANSETQIVLRKPNVDAPLTNHDGHIDLFPQEETKLTVSKNPEAEKDAARKAKEYEDQYTMRFSNAAGFKQGLESPWYSKQNDTSVETEVPSKDVWGNEDPRRKEREAKRIVSNDPLAFMKQGAARVRQVEKERKQWREDRKTELENLKRAEREERKRKRKHREEDDLEGFRLDGPRRESKHDGDRKRSRHEDLQHSSRRERSLERHRDRHRSRHGHEHGH